MKTVAILQARLNSTRLPNKVLLPLAGKSMLRNIVERVQRASSLHQVVIAIPSDDWGPINALALPCPLYWHDDEQDLVGRYVAAAEAFNADVIVRIPCDNPCIDPAYIDEAVLAYQRFPFIYYSNTTAMVGDVAIDGVGAEVLSRSRLHWLDQRTQGRPDWREHPHRYFESCGLLSLPQAALRLDVNTQADYDRIKTIYDHFGHNRFTADDVLQYVQALGWL